MSDLITRDDLGCVEGLFSPRSLVSFSLFGRRFRFLSARSRWAQITGSRVAVVIMHHDNAWERRAVKGIAVTLMNAFSPEEPPIIDVFSAERSDTRLNDEVLPSIGERAQEYCAIITIGAWVSTRIKEYIVEKKWKMPQIFVAVPNAADIGLVRNFEIPQPGIIGVNNASIDYRYALDILKEVLPTMRIVLVPHDAEQDRDGFEGERLRLAQLLAERGYDMRSVAIDFTGEVLEQLEPHLAGASVLWSVHEPVLQIHAKKIAKLCAQYSVIFCASELASVFQGADIGWGDSGSVAGAFAGQVCFALAMGISTTEIKNIEMSHPGSARTNPSFVERSSLSTGVRLLVRDVIPLGWE